MFFTILTIFIFMGCGASSGNQGDQVYQKIQIQAPATPTQQKQQASAEGQEKLSQTEIESICSELLAKATQYLEDMKTNSPECIAAFVENELATAMRAKIEGKQISTVLKFDEEMLSLWSFPIKWKYHGTDKAQKCMAGLQKELQGEKAKKVKCKGMKEVYLANMSGLLQTASEAIIRDIEEQFRTFRSLSGYQKAKWGMTLKEVKRVVKGLKKTDAGPFFRKDNIAGMQMGVGYTFQGDRLVGVGLLSLEKHSATSKYIEDFNRLKALLIQKYGQPTKDETVWDSEFREENMQDILDNQIHMGHAKLVAEWTDGKTAISLSCSADNFEIVNVIVYTSTEFNSWATYKQKADDASGL